MSEESGIYQIVHVATGRRYVGQALNIRRRWRDHRKSLNAGAHTSIPLQRAWDKYGTEAFEFSVIQICDAARLDELEQGQLDAGAHYNVLKIARSPRGVKRRQETRERIASALRGKPKTPEHRAALAAANRGKAQSEETRAKKSATMKGRLHTPEHRAKLTAANKARAGYKHTPKTIAKIKAACNKCC